MYKGMAFPFAAQVAFKVVIFTTNGVSRRVLDKRGLAESPAGVFACGALSGDPRVFLLISCPARCAVRNTTSLSESVVYGVYIYYKCVCCDFDRLSG